MTIGMHSTDIPAGTVPDWIHLLPLGAFTGVDGRGPYIAKDPRSIISASMHNGGKQTRLPVDVNHSTDLAGPRGEPSPAVGWITEMEQRSDGIWGRVDWTPAGRILLESRAYRGISPVFSYGGDDRVITLIQRAALTNMPNLPQLASLNSSNLTAVPGHSAPGQLVLATYQPTPEDVRMCAKMGYSVKDLVDMKNREMASQLTFGLSKMELRTCALMNLDPSEFAATKEASETGRMAPRLTYGLSKMDLNTCVLMNLDPLEFAATKEASETGREASFGLTPEEQDACRRMKISLRDYAVSKRDGTPDPLYSALTPEAKNLCESMKMDPRQFALWHVANQQNATALGLRA